MAKIQLGPYINFQGQAREAMQFYQSVLGGNLNLQTSAGQGGSGSAADEDRIMYARLDADMGVIIGVDGYPATAGDNIAIGLGGTDEDQLTRIFTSLAEGGQIKMPLSEQPGGVSIGYLVDKFGITWAVSINKG